MSIVWIIFFIDKFIIVFNDMIADIMTNKKFQAIIKELFIRCRKLNLSLVFITQTYFSIQKEVRLNSTHYLIKKIHNKRELQNIATNNSADIGYKDFIKIYRKCTSEPLFFIIDTTFICEQFKNQKKIFYIYCKNDITDEFKVLNDKIKANEAQYNLDREVAKLSALSSIELDKYEYLTGEDLGYKPGVAEKVNIEYSPLGEA